jgi:AraC-like DNA-binding protein
MAPSGTIPTIQVAATAGILEFIARAGASVADVVSEAELELGDFQRPQVRLPLRKFVTLIEAASRATGDDCFGAHLGEICSLRELGLPGYLATFAPTVEQALTSFARYYYLLGDATDVRFEKRGSRAGFTYTVQDAASWPRRQDAEQVLTMITSLLREWIGRDFSPSMVWFEHERPPGAEELRRVLGCPVRFDCPSNTVFFDVELAQHENPKADARLFHLLSWFAETVLDDSRRASTAGSFREQVLASIATASNLGNASIDSVARALGLESRTFQRRLRAERTSFRELYEEYLQTQAQKLLSRSELGEKDIAARLGYGSLTAFIRAFRRWHGVTPGQFRERRADAELLSHVVAAGASFVAR